MLALTSNKVLSTFFPRSFGGFERIFLKGASLHAGEPSTLPPPCCSTSPSPLVDVEFNSAFQILRSSSTITPNEGRASVSCVHTTRARSIRFFSRPESPIAFCLPFDLALRMSLIVFNSYLLFEHAIKETFPLLTPTNLSAVAAHLFVAPVRTCCFHGTNLQDESVYVSRINSASLLLSVTCLFE